MLKILLQNPYFQLQHKLRFQSIFQNMIFTHMGFGFFFTTVMPQITSDYHNPALQLAKGSKKKHFVNMIIWFIHG